MERTELDKILDRNNYSWIKVKRHDPDQDQLDDNEAYRQLHEHHLKETNFLIEKCRQLAEAVKQRDVRFSDERYHLAEMLETHAQQLLHFKSRLV